MSLPMEEKMKFEQGDDGTMSLSGKLMPSPKDLHFVGIKRSVSTPSMQQALAN
jgi:hypothetical protein